MLKTDFSKFAPEATDYASFNALILAEASQLAYKTEAEIKQTVRDSWQFPKEAEFVEQRDANMPIFQFKQDQKVADTQAFVAGNDRTIIVAFRGTEPDNAGDWKNNFKFKKFPVKLANSNQKVHVHEGFWRALDIVWADITKLIRTFRDRNQSIWLTGHSLGGALASLAAFRLSQSSEFTYNGLYTFGQPRVGAWGFANELNKSDRQRIFRFVNNNDLVAAVPPFLFGYAHVGQLYYLTADREVVKNGLPFSRAALDRVVGFRDFGELDHDLGTYIEIVRESTAN